MKMLIAMLTLLFTGNAFALGTVTVTKQARVYQNGKQTRVIKIHWVADASAGTVPNIDITGLGGFLVKAVTKPGATAPTSLYDLALVDKSDAGVDAFGGALADRSATVAEQIFPQAGTGGINAYLQPDTYTFKLTNNSVNSATGDVYLYLVDSL